MTLKKQAKVTTPPVHPYKVRFGTRNELGDEHQFATESAARNGIITAFKAWEPWCERYNRNGLETIKDACDRVGSTMFHREHSRIECIFDAHSGMHVAAEYWTTR